MSEERRKTNKQDTGTVPKTKCRNNTSYTNERDSPRSWTNNLASDFQRLNLPDYVRNSRRNLPHSNYCTMNTALEEPQRHLNASASTGSVTPNTSSSNSRRNSSTGAVPKCDNVTKYPDKKQIEDKLSQIKEYLQITNSLMSSIKNTDDQSEDSVAELKNLMQMHQDLKDSEAKLVDILESVEFYEQSGETTENGIDSVNSELGHRNESDEAAFVRSLQQKAENRLRDGRQAQEKLFAGQFGNDLNSTSNRRDKNLASVQDFDLAIRQLEERTKRLKGPSQQQGSNPNLQDKLLAEVDYLQNQIVTLHNVNDDRTQLIHVLDNRDAELRAQHLELQSKLSELQNRKQQVDQLVSQLQNLDEADEDDVGAQVRKIVTMKDQLSKLKDMLEIVKTTDSVMQNTNGTATQEEQELACEICTKAENFLQKDAEKFKPSVPEINVALRYENGGLNETHHKQINKIAAPGGGGDRHGFGGAKPRTSSNCNKMALQAELEAKKRELEEIMGKHKAGTSNLNHDVGNDNKSEFSCASNAFFDGASTAWVPLMSDHNRFGSSESGDECVEDVNEYSDLNSSHHQNQSFTLPLMNFPRESKREKQRIDPEYVHVGVGDHISAARTPERSVRSNSVAASYTRERPRSNSEQDNNKKQVQKQLELIRSVCESMLEQQQQPNNNHQQQQPSNVQQLRNNLTPSPLYSEPRRFTSPNPHPMNALNVVNPIVENGWCPVSNNQVEVGNVGYQGWLANNALQSQTFMMNTLNQCCQMLWIQQRELISLRQTLTQMQERMDNPMDGGSSQLASPLQPTPVGEPRSCNQFRSNQKVNQVSSACSMPNLNQYNVVPPNANLAQPFANNMQNARLLDPCLNNANLNLNPMPNGDHHHINNSMMHGVNANINHHHQTMQGQMWNGQALNNQVAPGNRANNYWDNFRSYSRQNLLSTKSNEGLVSSTLDRSNVSTSERTNPFTLISLAKGNSDHVSSGNVSSQENSVPSRRTQFVPVKFVPIRHSDNQRNNSMAVVPPPDVLNVNHNATKVNDHPPVELPHLANARNEASNEQDADLCYQTYLNNVFAYNENSSNNSNISEEQIFKDCIPETTRRRNEWHEESTEEQYPKTKLFEDLRENVYKEVVTLISANEARPHFLIQLFKDLQMIGSDPLRLEILQSIQSVITHSLATANHPNRQILESQPPTNEQMISDCFSLQSTVWSKTPPKNPPVVSRSALHVEGDGVEVLNATKEIIPYLNDHEDDIINHHFLVALKQMLITSESFQETVKDTVFKKHFSNIIDEVLAQYRGKKVRDVKMHIIQNINDLIRGELSFIQLIQDTCPETCDARVSSSTPHANPASLIFDQPPPNVTVNGQVVDSSGAQIQNGDLAEADQERAEEDEVEEEGAVGGFWDLALVPHAITVNPAQINEEEVDISTIEFQNNTESQTQFIKQGLDQVPTRLPTKSRSNTPSKSEKL